MRPVKETQRDRNLIVGKRLCVVIFDQRAGIFSFRDSKIVFGRISDGNRRFRHASVNGLFVEIFISDFCPAHLACVSQELLCLLYNYDFYAE